MNEKKIRLFYTNDEADFTVLSIRFVSSSTNFIKSKNPERGLYDNSLKYIYLFPVTLLQIIKGNEDNN